MTRNPNDPESIRTSPLLRSAGFRHAFFTRHGGVSTGPFESLSFSVAAGDTPDHVDRNLARAADALGVAPERVYFLSQVHGAAVEVVRGTEDRREVVHREGDAVITAAPGAAAAVRIADCVPVLVADTRSGAVAAIHAGWKGLVAGVIPAAVARLRELAPHEPSLVAAVGPHISLAAFEVSDDVADTLGALAPGEPVVSRAYGPKPHVDLRRIAHVQLRAAGVAADAIDDVPGCTLLEPEHFFSFRRDGARSGRHLAAIVPR